jgi:hypothetical protein
MDLKIQTQQQQQQAAGTAAAALQHWHGTVALPAARAAWLPQAAATAVHGAMA